MRIRMGKDNTKVISGTFVVQLAGGTKFSVASGFSDKQREQPPAIGAVVTFVIRN